MIMTVCMTPTFPPLNALVDRLRASLATV
jgi:hypothetical protein